MNNRVLLSFVGIISLSLSSFCWSGRDPFSYADSRPRFFCAGIGRIDSHKYFAWLYCDAIISMVQLNDTIKGYKITDITASSLTLEDIFGKMHTFFITD